MGDGSRTKWAGCMCRRSLMALAIVSISRCMMDALTRRIARLVRSSVQANGICRSGRTRPGTYSLRSRHCEPILPTHGHDRSMSRNCGMPKKSSPLSKRRASGMDASTTTKRTRTEQCKINAQARSDKKRQAAFDALSRLKREQRPITKAAVARRAGVSVVFLRAHPDLVQAIEEAEYALLASPPPRDRADKSKDQVIDAL